MTTPNTALRAVRTSLHLSQDELARALRRDGDQRGDPNDASKRLVQKWEAGLVETPRGTYARALESVTGLAITTLGFRPGEDPPSRTPGDGLLEPVPAAFTADMLSGAWLTGYQFSTPAKHHADVAHIQVTSPRHVMILNFPPDPRTEGHATPYRNEITAELAGRHLLGVYKNTSDARYFGAIHLAVLPGETVMEGVYTGLPSDSDIHVVSEAWKWVRLDPGSVAGADFEAMTLRDPGELYSLIEKTTQYDAPLTIGEVTE